MAGGAKGSSILGKLRVAGVRKDPKQFLRGELSLFKVRTRRFLGGEMVKNEAPPPLAICPKEKKECRANKRDLAAMKEKRRTLLLSRSSPGCGRGRFASASNQSHPIKKKLRGKYR